MHSIAYKGEEGSFSYLAALNALGPLYHYVPEKTFSGIFDAVVNGRAHLGIVPLENSTAGSIYENYDLLAYSGLYIIGETFNKIELMLLGTSEASVRTLEKVYSHPKALEQAQQFFRRHPWIEPMPCHDTTSAAKRVAEAKCVTMGALSSRYAAEKHRLEIIQSHLEDTEVNTTRFVFVSQKPLERADKCSLLVTLNHAAGTLAALLSHLAERGANLTKIESRPIPQRPFEYQFYLDFLFKGTIVLDLEPYVNTMKILGLYRAGKRCDP